MKKWMIIIGILAIVGLIAAFLVWKFYVNKPHTDYAKAEATVSIAASDLFNNYKSNKTTADSMYNGKVIEIKGAFQKIEKTDSSATIIFVFTQGDFGDEGIRCSLLPTELQKLGETQAGQDIKLKGLCTGYNETDVILEKCSIEK